MLPVLAHPQADSNDVAVCRSETAAGDAVVAACTRIIDSGRHTNNELRNAFYNRGQSLTKQGLYDRAIENYTSAIRLDPSNGDFYFLRGEIFRHHKSDITRAIQDYTAAIRLYPDHSPYYLHRGMAYSDTNNLKEAIADYTAGLKLGPPNARLYANRGMARSLMDEHDLAIADYTEAIKLDPNYWFAPFGRSTAWQAKKEYDRAIADINEAMRLLGPNRNVARTYRIRSSIWFDKGNFTQSLFDSYEIIKQERGSGWAHNHAAWLLATAPFPHRSGTRAVELATRACELTDWKNPSYLDTLAAAHAEAGNFPEAVRWQQRALEFPDFEKRRGTDARQRLVLYRSGQPYRMPRPN